MNALELTDAAVRQVQKLVDEKDDAIALRIGVKAGGCSGYQYIFEYESDTNFNDILVSYRGANVIIDQDSMQLLMGSTLDYVENLAGSEFTITNPNAVGSRGCGKSFS